MQFGKARALQFGSVCFCYSSTRSDSKLIIADYCCLSNSSNLGIKDSYLSYDESLCLISKEWSIWLEKDLKWGLRVILVLYFGSRKYFFKGLQNLS